MSSCIPLFPHFFLIQHSVDIYRLHRGAPKPAGHYAEPVQFPSVFGTSPSGAQGGTSLSAPRCVKLSSGKQALSVSQLLMSVL